MAKLTGSYNEYGYVIRKNSRVIYAAGNGAQGSQDYIGIYEFKESGYRNGEYHSKGFLLKESIPEEAFGDTVEPTWKIKELCESTLIDMAERPELYELKGEYIAGKISYSEDLNPLEEAYKCGALTK